MLQEMEVATQNQLVQRLDRLESSVALIEDAVLVNRNYCECTQCTHNSNCSSFNGLPTGCEGEPAGSGDVYAAGFAAGKECGAGIWVEALRSAYVDLGQC